MRTGFDRFAVAGLGDDRRVLRLDGDGEEALFTRFKHLGDAGDGSARAHGRHQNIHLAIGVAPDLLGGREPVDLRIGRILKLLGNPGIGQVLMQVLGLLNGAFHPFGARREHQFGAQEGEQGTTFQAHRFGHG